MSVPQIDTPLLLDILLGLTILLFVPFGIRRGVAKEAMVSAGILLGATLAERFSQDWGAVLSRTLNLDQGAAHFAAAALTLFACTFLLGYGGAALGAIRPGTLGRLVGGLLAAFNAALLLSYLLDWINRILQQGAALDDGIVSRALVLQADRLLLYGAGVLLALTVLGWIVSATRSRRQPHEDHAARSTSIPARQRPVRVAPGADTGKYEPVGEIPRSGRFGPGLDATSPLPSTAAAAAQGWADAGHGPAATNGHGHDAFADGPTLASGPGTDANDETVWAAWNAPVSRDATGRSESSQWPVAPVVGVTDDARCAVCHARVGPRDVFCPECGATL